MIRTAKMCIRDRDNQSADNETASKQKETSEQNDEPEQKAPASGHKEAGGNQSNACLLYTSA